VAAYVASQAFPRALRSLYQSVAAYVTSSTPEQTANPSPRVWLPRRRRSPDGNWAAASVESRLHRGVAPAAHEIHAGGQHPGPRL